MAPKRGMSLEDKRLTLLNIFHETQDVFLLKVRLPFYFCLFQQGNILQAVIGLGTPPRSVQDVEKLGAKRGVVLQSIKDVLQSLVDDDLVHCERIGVSNYFWSFPSEAAVRLEAEAGKLGARLQALQKEHAALEAQLAESRVGKEDSVSWALPAPQEALVR
jgi:hypothetical protein